MKKITKQTFKIFWQHSRNHKVAGFLTIGGITCAVITQLANPIYYKFFFDTLANSDANAETLSQLIKLLLIILGINALAWVFFRIASFATFRFQVKTMEEMSVASFDYLHGHSFSFFTNRFVGALVRKANRLIDAYENIGDQVIWDLYPLALRTITILIVVFFWNSLIGFIISGWIILYLFLNYIFTMYKMQFDVKIAEIDSNVTAYLADSITNNQNIKLFNAHQKELAAFSKLAKKQRQMRIFDWDLSGYIDSLQAALMFLLEFIVFYIAIKFWAKGAFTVGDFALIQAYLITLFMHLWNVGRVIQRVYQNLANAEEMVEILNKPHEIQDKKTAAELKVNSGKIEFKNVSFSYNKTREVIKKFNLAIEAGEKIGLVGPSGSGKTTIVGLLFRFFDLPEGKIVIDDQNIADVKQSSLRQQMSFVPQDPILFHRTLMENIRYGKPGASDQEVIAAAKAAHCHEFIDSLPEKYHSYVGERGIKLSGGERQRVAIARAILKNAPILVLDEATSSLDSHVELLIQDALTKLMEGKTAIVIAHRLSTIMKLDRIVVLDQGKISEVGSHVKLLKNKDGLYKKLWTLQAGGFIQ